jgi:hypothetical protein
MGRGLMLLIRWGVMFLREIYFSLQILIQDNKFERAAFYEAMRFFLVIGTFFVPK